MGKRFVNFFSRLERIFENLFTWKGGLKKYIEWTLRRGYKIEKIEGSSFREAKISFWHTSRNTVCAKLIVSDSSSERKGLYLLLSPYSDSNFAQSRLVSAEEIKFNCPYQIVDEKLVLLNQQKEKL